MCASVHMCAGGKRCASVERCAYRYGGNFSVGVDPSHYNGETALDRVSNDIAINLDHDKGICLQDVYAAFDRPG